MSERDRWTTPDGWGGPPVPPAPVGSPGPVTGPAQPPGGGEGHGAPHDHPGSVPKQDGALGAPGAYGTSGGSPWGAARVALKPGVVPLRPLGLGEVLDGAVGVIRRYPRPTLGLAALVAVVTTLLNVVVVLTAFRPLLALDPVVLEDGGGDALQGAIGGAVAGGALTVVLTLLAGAVLTGGLAAVVGKAVLGEPMSFGQAWAQVRPLLLRLVGLAVLTLGLVYLVVVVAVVVAVLALTLGGPPLALVAVPVGLGGLALALHLYVRLSLAPCVLVLERTGITASMRRSGVLVKRDWWRVFGVLALTFVIGAFVSQIVQLPFAVLGAGSPGGLVDPDAEILGTRSLVLSAIGGGVASTLVSPFTAGVRALLYVDRRMRAEGLDVALAAKASARP